MNNINYTTSNNLCLGCGLCSDACPTNSINMKVVNGEYRPIVNSSSCINSKGCHRCSMVCPGVGIALNQIGLKKFGIYDECRHHNLIGFYSKASLAMLLIMKLVSMVLLEDCLLLLSLSFWTKSLFRLRLLLKTICLNLS